MSLLTKHVNQLYKKRQSKFRGSRRIGDRSESTFGLKKLGVGKDVIYFERKEPGHNKNEFPKLKKDRPEKKDFRGKKKGLMETWDDSEEEQGNVALTASTKAPNKKIQSELESESDSEEVFPNLSCSKLESCLSEILEKYQKLQNKYKDLKQVHGSKLEAHSKLKKDFSTLNEEKFILKNENSTLQSKSSKLEEEIM